MAYSGEEIARAFIQIASESGTQITHLKLQKLLYFAHGWHLAFYDQPLLDERIEAWKHGPVVRTVYKLFKDGGGTPLRYDGKDYLSGLSDETRDLLLGVWKTYGSIDAFDLSKMTHTEDSPWRGKYEQQGFFHDSDYISDEEMKKYFLNLQHANA